ncbi:odorant receptor 94b-like [Bradysia coprophila]|uniref:odorant receptor 94b-like n=1 Tax=Bradysia coprophila TaxID=38358 RepID=UPI00187D7305|nr:odorant receptor 94b-like [Bradysia coprophila]
MHSVKMSKVISLLISIFFLSGVWQRGTKNTVRDIPIKSFSCSYHVLFVLSLLMGAIKNREMEKSIFLALVAIGSAILSIRLWLLIWKQNQILDLLNRICVFSIRNDADFKHFNEKLKGFMTFVLLFFVAVTFVDATAGIVFPLITRGQSLYLEIAFPLDYRNSDIGRLAANFFLFTEIVLSYIATIFSIVIWYLLLICSLRYNMLGSDLRNMGRCNEKRKLKVAEHHMQNNFLNDLRSSIEAQLHLRELTAELGNFFSDMFFFQFCTSGLSICFSVYCLAFDVGAGQLERSVIFVLLFYFISELFMITYFGNEIKLTSNHLSYCLYESDWYNQSQTTKIYIIIFAEYLKQPQEVLIGKLYPLTLETFTRIFNSAYSMFNILKRFQQ